MSRTASGSMRQIVRTDTTDIDRLRAIVAERKARHAEAALRAWDAVQALRAAEEGRENASESLHIIEAAERGRGGPAK